MATKFSYKIWLGGKVGFGVRELPRTQKRMKKLNKNCHFNFIFILKGLELARLLEWQIFRQNTFLLAKILPKVSSFFVKKSFRHVSIPLTCDTRKSLFYSTF